MARRTRFPGSPVESERGSPVDRGTAFDRGSSEVILDRKESLLETERERREGGSCFSCCFRRLQGKNIF
jgi:hypothetical protein